MSYEVFKKIKYNKQTRAFDCSSYSSNVFPRTPSSWEMRYYADKYPTATEEELKAALILQGIYGGDRYGTGCRWAVEMQKIARVWIDKKEKAGEKIDYYDFENARALARFIAEYSKKPVVRYCLLDNAGRFIKRINPTSYAMTYYGNDAKSFSVRTLDELFSISDVKWLIDERGFEPVVMQ